MICISKRSKYIFYLLIFLIYSFPFFRLVAEDITVIPDLKTSGVPIHKAGKYLSPFANPDFGEPAKVRVGFLLKSISSYSIKEAKFFADFLYFLYE
jgi:hypothetical protein